MATYADKILEAGPLAYYPMQETSGSIMTALAGSNGVYANVLVNQPPLIAGGSGSIGSTSSGKMVCPNPIPSGSPFSVELWVKIPYRVSAGCLVSDGVPTSDFRWMLGYAPHTMGTGTSRIFWGPASYAAAQYNYVDGEIHHCVGTYDQTSGIINAYLDGVLVYTDTRTFNHTQGASLTLSYFNDSLIGDFSDFAVYDRVLTPQEIADHYDWGINGVPQLADSATITGTILLDGAPVDATVLLMRDSDRLVVSETTSDELTGEYSFVITGDALEEVPYYVICLYGEGIRPLIHGPVIPEITGTPPALVEVQLLGSAENSAFVTASSVHSSGIYPASAAFNGVADPVSDLDAWISSATGNFPNPDGSCYLQFDFSVQKKVASLALFPRGSSGSTQNFPADIRIKVSDDPSFSTYLYEEDFSLVFAAGDWAGVQTIASPTSGQFLRIEILSMTKVGNNYDWVAVQEVKFTELVEE